MVDTGLPRHTQSMLALYISGGSARDRSSSHVESWRAAHPADLVDRQFRAIAPSRL